MFLENIAMGVAVSPPATNAAGSAISHPVSDEHNSANRPRSVTQQSVPDPQISTSTPTPPNADKKEAKASSVTHTDQQESTPTPHATESQKNSGLSISAVWEGMKRMMGFTDDCHNGGYKIISGHCICPQFYEGKTCERIMCANNGTRVRVAAFGGEEVCKCPHPDYISGKHCEVVHCQNGGRLLNDGTCHCVDGWYSGQFCQFYTSSWLIAIGVPLLAVAAIVFCCVLCRLDLCAMRRVPAQSNGRQRYRRPNGRRCGQTQPTRSRAEGAVAANRHRREQIQPQNCPEEGGIAPRNPQQFYIQQNLLNDRQQQQQQQQQQYVLRLEQIPAYNPRLYMMSDPTKPLEPPPSYEQAILCSPPNCPPIYRPNQSGDENRGGRETTEGTEEREGENGGTEPLNGEGDEEEPGPEDRERRQRSNE